MHGMATINEEFFEFLRFQSISADPAFATHMESCAQWVVYKFTQMGFRVRLERAGGHPSVIAFGPRVEGAPTVLVYGHYDVQPVDPIHLWTSPPFEPRISNGKVYARGATDNKGQIFSHFIGSRSMVEAGGLPVNLVYLIEGEEEIGSPTLPAILKRLHTEIQPDIALVSDTGMIAPGHPTLTYSLRGIAALEVAVHGAATDLHSGIYGGVVANPALALCRLLSTLHDESGRVAIQGFYDNVLEPEEWERQMVRFLPIGEKELLAITGAPALTGEAGYLPLERTGARPTAEINGLGSGYQGPGSKTVIPAVAMAKLTFRLVPNQDPAVILALAEQHLRKHCPLGVSLEINLGHSGRSYFFDPRSPWGSLAQQALVRVFNKPGVACIREGGSIPIVSDFKNILGCETLLMGLALPDCRAHAPDENFPLEHINYGGMLHAELLRLAAQVRL